MGQLNNAALRRALNVARGLAELQELAEFPAWSATALRRLIPCDVASYNAVDPTTQRAAIAVDPGDSVFEGGEAALASYIHQNPLVSHYAATGDARALRISDFMTVRELRRTELYDYVYRHLDLEHQLAITLPAPRNGMDRPGEVIGLTVSRGHRDFSEGERLLLEGLRDPFAATLARLHELALLRAVAEEAGRDSSRWLVLVSREGLVAWTSTAASEGLGLLAGERLPAALCRWVEDERARQARFASHGGGRVSARGGAAVPRRLDASLRLRLRPRLVHDAYPGLDALHLTPVEELPGPDALRSLGLTPRQAEVLALALEGQTSGQIAFALSLSVRTVEKHFEGAYDRLGAANRAQAVSLALQALASDGQQAGL
jgi:DNA-binding CsgD family transcriptional regulator